MLATRLHNHIILISCCYLQRRSRQLNIRVCNLKDGEGTTTKGTRRTAGARPQQLSAWNPPPGTRILTYVVTAIAYEVMVAGEKQEEFRQSSEWNRCRLYANRHSATRRRYEFVRIYRGYSASEMFVAEYLGFNVVKQVCKTYSNGLRVHFHSSRACDTMYRIKLGRIVHNVSASRIQVLDLNKSA